MWGADDRLFVLVGGAFAIVYISCALNELIKKKCCKNKVSDVEIPQSSSPTNSSCSELSFEDVELYLKPDYSSNDSSEDQYYDPNDMIPDAD